MLRSTTPPRPTSSWRNARLIALIAAPSQPVSVGIASDASASVVTSRSVSVLEGVAACGEERLLEGRRAVARLQLVGRLEAEQVAVVEDPDAIGQRFGLGQVVRAE